MLKNSIMFMEMPDGGVMVADVDEFINELCGKPRKWRDNLKSNMMLWYRLNNDTQAALAIDRIFEEAARRAG